MIHGKISLKNHRSNQPRNSFHASIKCLKAFAAANVFALLLNGCAMQQQTPTPTTNQPEPLSDLSISSPEQLNSVSPARLALDQVIGARISTPDQNTLPSYRRGDYMNSWLDLDKDCQDTRQEVLIAESIEPATLDESGCTVLAGRWLDPYTNLYFTDPKKLDIDHVVPLSEAHMSGAFTWTRERKRAYANDLGNLNALLAVQAGANRSKGDRDPAQWLPPNAEFYCSYIAMLVEVKTINDLAYDADEVTMIKGILAECQ